MATQSRIWTLKASVSEYATARKVIFNRTATRPCGRNVLMVSPYGSKRTQLADVVSLRFYDEPEVDFIRWLDTESITPDHVVMDVTRGELAVSFTNIDHAMRCKLAFPELVGSEEDE